MKPILLAALLALIAGAVQATPTHVMIRAQALDAKFIGTHMGGVRITLTDARTGAVLAEGLTSGGSGDSAKIMRAPRVRGASIADADTAGFDAVVDIDRPTLVRIDGFGPVGRPASAIHVSSSLWLTPGRDLTGDGLVLVFPGLAIEPAVTAAVGGGLQVTAKVTLMCGCPIEAGGLWDAANYTVEATLLRGDHIVGATPLAFAGQPSQFAAALPKLAPGRYILRIVARDAKSANVGAVEQPFVAEPPRD